MQRDPASGKFRHRRRHSIEFESDVLQDEFNDKTCTAVNEEHLASDAGASPSNSFQMVNASQFEQNTREQWAATCIQTAFRGVLVTNLLLFLSSQNFATCCLFLYVLNFKMAIHISYTICWITFLSPNLFCSLSKPSLDYEQTYFFDVIQIFYFVLLIRWNLCAIFLLRKTWKTKLIMCRVAESNFNP